MYNDLNISLKIFVLVLVLLLPLPVFGAIESTIQTIDPPILNFSEESNFGETTLERFFLPDPYVVSVTSGGIVDASYLGG